MLDNCYEGTPASLASAVFSESLRDNLTNIFSVLRFLNEFHEPDIMLYSTTPGTVVPMVPDPLDSGSNVGVGPLARRFLLVVDKVLRNSKVLTLGDFLQQMTNLALDTKTSPAVSYAELKIPETILVRKVASREGRKPDERVGSGVPREEIIIPAGDLPRSRTFGRAGSTNSLFRFESDSGEWVGQGKAMSLTGDRIEITLEEDSPNRLAFAVKGDGEEWTVEFEAPGDVSLTEGVYKKATRSGFQGGADAGFSASSNSRGCNELIANFWISRVKA